MRKLILLCLVGCAPTPVVTLRVSPAAAMRLDGAKRLEGQNAIEAARKTETQAALDVKRAEAERAGPAVADKKQTPELDAVMRAADERHAAMVAWRRSQLTVAHWQVAAAEAQLELVTAEAVARTGADVDPARFRGQAANMQSGRIDASRKSAQARTQLDQREKALNDAKDRYAATLKPTTQLSSAQPR